MPTFSKNIVYVYIKNIHSFISKDGLLFQWLLFPCKPESTIKVSIMDSINAYFQSIQFCVFFRQILISFITMNIFTIKKKLAIKIKIVYHAYLHLFIIIILICLCIQYIMFFLIDLKYLCVRMTTTLTENWDISMRENAKPPAQMSEKV